MDGQLAKNHFMNFAQKLVKFSADEYAALEDNLEVRLLEKGEHFLKEGEVCRQIGFVAKGYMRLYYLSDGADITKSINFENEFCGSYASFITGTPARFNVVAMEQTTLVVLNYLDLMELYDQYPSILKLGRMAIEYRFVKIEQREASLLLDNPQQRYYSVLQNQPHFLQRVTLKHLASYLGMTPETLSRIRNRIRK